MADSIKQEAREHSEQFRIDVEKIGEEIESQAAIYNYFATLYIRAKGVELENKMKVKETRAGVWLMYKEQMKNEKPKPTIDDLKALVDTDINVLNAEKELREATQLVNQLDEDRQSSWLKGDMLKLMSFEAKRHYKDY